MTTVYLMENLEGEIVKITDLAYAIEMEHYGWKRVESVKIESLDRLKD